MNHIDNYDQLPDNIDQYTLINQSLPSITMEDDNGNTHHCHAINDIIIGKNLVDYFHFDIHSESIHQTIKGTGLILSTPIGSTAYRHKNG
jgi:NAD kinase